MSAAYAAVFIAAFVTVTGGYVSTVWFIVSRIDRRLESLEQSVAHLREDVAVLKATR